MLPKTTINNAVIKITKVFIPILPRALYSFTQIVALIVAKHIFNLGAFYIFSIVFGLSFWVVLGDLGYQLTIQKAYSEVLPLQIRNVRFIIVKNIKWILGINILVSAIASLALSKIYFSTFDESNVIIFFSGLTSYAAYSLLNIISRVYYYENKLLNFSKYFCLTFLLSLIILAYFYFTHSIGSVAWFIVCINAPQILYFLIIYCKNISAALKYKPAADVKAYRLLDTESRKQIMLSIVAIAVGQLDILVLTYFKINANKLSEYILYSRLFAVVYTLYSTRLPFMFKFFYKVFIAKKISTYYKVAKKSFGKYSLVNIGVFAMLIVVTLSYKLLSKIGITFLDNIVVSKSLIVLSLLFILTELKGISEIQSALLGAIFQQKYLIKIVVVQSFVSIIAQFFFIKLMGVTGIILAMALSFFMVAVLQFFKIKSKFNVQ